MKFKYNLIAALFIISPLLVFSTEYFIASSDINIRTGAGTSYSVFFTLKKGDEVERLTKKGEWYQIKYSG